jgi:hypothetical protein
LYTDLSGENIFADTWDAATDAVKDTARKIIDAAKKKLDEAIQIIKEFIDSSTQLLTDSTRQADLCIGIAVSLVKPLLDAAAISTYVAVDIIEIITGSNVAKWLYINYNNNLDQILEKLVERLRYPDSYYLGRMIGDIGVIAVGIFGGADGIAKIVEGIGFGAEGTACGAVATATGVGAPAGIAVIGGSLVSAAALIETGAMELGACAILASEGVTNFGNDYNSFRYNNKIDCENSNGGSGNGGTGSSVTVNYKGEDVAVYRGGKDFTVNSEDIKIDKKTGMVKNTHGISIDVNPSTVSKFGGAYRIDSLPDGLKIIQRGLRAEHFEIVPKENMTLEAYQNLLNQIKSTLVSG